MVAGLSTQEAFVQALAVPSYNVQPLAEGCMVCGIVPAATDVALDLEVAVCRDMAKGMASPTLFERGGVPCDFHMDARPKHKHTILVDGHGHRASTVGEDNNARDVFSPATLSALVGRSPVPGHASPLLLVRQD